MDVEDPVDEDDPLEPEEELEVDRFDLRDRLLERECSFALAALAFEACESLLARVSPMREWGRIRLGEMSVGFLAESAPSRIDSRSLRAAPSGLAGHPVRRTNDRAESSCTEKITDAKRQEEEANKKSLIRESIDQ